VLVSLTRTGPPPPDRVRELVQGAFAHRRKAMARSLQTAGVARRDDVRAALERMDLPVDVRAERLGPEEFRRLAQELS
jgi:16S rRNA (adenine1518-N6/adenine1519-N6)-dimethyltransferase